MTKPQLRREVVSKPIATEVVDGRITVNLAMTILQNAGVTIQRRTLYRELHRRRVQLYRVGSTLTFHPSVIVDLIQDRRD